MFYILRATYAVMPTALLHECHHDTYAVYAARAVPCPARQHTRAPASYARAQRYARRARYVMICRANPQRLFERCDAYRYAAAIAKNGRYMLLWQSARVLRHTYNQLPATRSYSVRCQAIRSAHYAALQRLARQRVCDNHIREARLRGVYTASGVV